MRAYHRVDPLMDERKSHYSPAQLGAFLKVQLLAGRQSKRGRFRSLDALRGALPAPYVRHLDFLLAEGDVVVSPDGVYVDGWDEWQEGDLTVKDRMARLRDRKRNPTVTDAVTPTVTEPVTLASPTANANAKASADFDGEGSGEGLPNLTELVAEAWQDATGRSVLASGRFAQDYLDDACRRHDEAAILRGIVACRARFKVIPTPQQLTSALRQHLDPFPDAKKAQSEDREEADRSASRKRVEATLRQTHGLGAHAKAKNPQCPLCRESAA